MSHINEINEIRQAQVELVERIRTFKLDQYNELRKI